MTKYRQRYTAIHSSSSSWNSLVSFVTTSFVSRPLSLSSCQHKEETNKTRLKGRLHHPLNQISWSIKSAPTIGEKEEEEEEKEETGITYCWTVGKRVRARQSRGLTGRESLSLRHVRLRIWMPPPQIGDVLLPSPLRLVEPVSIGGVAAFARQALHGDGCHLYLSIRYKKKKMDGPFYSSAVPTHTHTMRFGEDVPRREIEIWNWRRQDGLKGKGQEIGSPLLFAILSFQSISI